MIEGFTLLVILFDKSEVILDIQDIKSYYSDTGPLGGRRRLTI